MASCPNCGTEENVIRQDNGDGTFTYYPPVDNIVTLPPEDPDEPWEGIPGEGVEIIPGGTLGHGPTISVCLADGDSGLEFVNGCLSVTGDNSPPWTSPNIAAPSGGIVVFPGGTDGHSPSYAIVIHPDSDGTRIVDGQLLVECCEDLEWQPSLCAGGGGLAITPGDNPAGEAGNGHRPEFCILVDGTSIAFNDDGQLSVVGDGTAMIDLCPQIQVLPDLPEGQGVQTIVGIGDDGDCYKIPQCIVYADAGGQEWDENNPGWIDPASVDKWCELRLDNGITGCELWRQLHDVNGVPQWHQVA